MARVLGVVMPRTCGDGFWVHLALNLMFGSIGIKLEMEESKGRSSKAKLAGCSAIVPTRERYIAP